MDSSKVRAFKAIYKTKLKLSLRTKMRLQIYFTLDRNQMFIQRCSLVYVQVHTEKSFLNLIKSTPKSDCIYHAPIDLEHQTDSVRLRYKSTGKW